MRLLCVLHLPRGPGWTGLRVTFKFFQHLYQVLGLLLHALRHGALPHPEVPQGAECEPPQLPPLLLVVGDKTWGEAGETAHLPTLPLLTGIGDPALSPAGEQ